MDVENKQLSDDQLEELKNGLALVNNVEFSTLKVIEELHELGMVLTKSLTKIEVLKPRREELVEELGDTICRIMLLTSQMGVDDEVGARIDGKLCLLYDAWKAGKLGSRVLITKTEP